MATPTFPTEVFANILSRLRVKPLLRFKCVSKSWYSLINSPKFIKLHLSKTLISDNHPNLLISHNSLSSAVIDDGGTDKNLRTIRFSELDHPLKHLSDQPAVEILGSCNGLVLISDCDKEFVFLYNPSNQTHRLIPPFKPSPLSHSVFENVLDPKNANMVLFGFGYDSVSDDYKALRVIETRMNYAAVYYEAAVYSLRSDSWKCVFDEQWRNYEPFDGALFNECLHYIVVANDDDDFVCNIAIKCFNLGTEEFSIFSIPEGDGGRCSAITGELGGYFFVGFNYLNSPPTNQKWIQSHDDRMVKSDFWVMKEYGKEESWVKLYTFSAANISGCLREVRPVLYSKDRRRLLLDVDGYCFGWYDIERNKFKRIKAYGTPPPSAPFETWTFVDNLVSLCRHNGKSKAAGTAIKKMMTY